MNNTKRIILFFVIVCSSFCLSGCSELRDDFSIFFEVTPYDSILDRSVQKLDWSIINYCYNAVVIVQAWHWPKWIGFLCIVGGVAAFIWYMKKMEKMNTEGAEGIPLIILFFGPLLGCALLGLNEGFFHWGVIRYVVDVILYASVLSVVVFPIASKSLFSLFVGIVIFASMFLGCAAWSIYLAMVSHIIFFVLLLPIIIILVWILFLRMA